MDKTIITHEGLLSVLHYEPETGVFTWRGGHGKVRAGKIAGHSVRSEDRIKLCVFGRLYNAHRIAWFYMTGQWPTGDIDHINGHGKDNRWINLRDVSHLTNMQNEQRGRKHSSHGYLGVVANGRGKWWARIRHPDGRRLHLGTYETAPAAHAAYLEKKRELHEGCTI